MIDFVVILLICIDGSVDMFVNYKGNVLLVVNVVFKCGFILQYEGFEMFYKGYKDCGFEVLGFFVNDFVVQEFGMFEEIQEFCKLNYGVLFLLFVKVDVSGFVKQLFYVELIQVVLIKQGDVDSMKECFCEYGWILNEDFEVLWNFEKFLIGCDGMVVGCFVFVMVFEDLVLVVVIESVLVEQIVFLVFFFFDGRKCVLGVIQSFCFL